MGLFKQQQTVFLWWMFGVIVAAGVIGGTVVWLVKR